MNSLQYLSRIIEIDHERSCLDLFFKNKEIEETYFNYNLLREKRRMKFACILIFIGYIVHIFATHVLGRSTSFNIILKISGILIDVIFTIFQVLKMNLINMRIIKISKLVRYAIIYLVMMISMIHTVATVITTADQINNNFFLMSFLLSLILMYLLDYNIIYVLIYCLLSSVIYALIVIFFLKETSYASYTAIFFSNIYTIFLAIYQRDCLSLNKNLFFQSYKNEKISEYIQKLLDDLNLYIISIQKDEVLYVNKKFQTEISFLFQEGAETNTNLNSNIAFNPENIIKFFDNLKKIDSDDIRIKDSINAIFDNKSINLENEFSQLGQYCLQLSNEEKSYEVYFRKNCFNSKTILDIVMYDLTKIKKYEKEVCESKYKQKILGKIAHEFKTPLITISSIINSLDENKSSKNFLLTKIEHIKNLSNYTIFLISDVVAYVSDKMDKLEVIKERVDLKEITEFCFHVLKTLIECNEQKANQISTYYEFDDEIINNIVISDEIRLKQILLNLVSNAFKFTKIGEIKISVRMRPCKKVIRLKVRDTGIGINSNISEKILKENIELNIETKYNKYGSGIGLSITKMLSNLLNHKISFKNRKKGGTSFILDMDCVSIYSSPKKNLITNFRENVEFIDSDSVNTVKINDLYYNKNDLLNCSPFSIRRSSRLSRMRNSQFLLNHLNDKIVFSIVIIDDVKYIREQTKNLINQILGELNIFSYSIYEGSDGIDLLKILKNDQEFDLKIKMVLIDENMEYLSGSETIKIIRGLEEINKFKKYKIISVTAFEDVETKNSIYSSNPDGIIQKPCSKNSLLSLLKPYIETQFD